MTLTIAKPGILTTVQDLGRVGHRSFGINPAGAMDRTAVRLINILLGSDDNAAVLEMHFPAPEIRFGADCVFALGGADLDAHLAGRAVLPWRLHLARKGDVLKFNGRSSGFRCYLGVTGGLRVEKWLESSSTNLAAGFGGRRLAAGDEIELNDPVNYLPGTGLGVSRSLIPRYSEFPTVRITPGAEFGLLAPDARERLLSDGFAVSDRSDRMGYRLAGPPLSLAEPLELLSSAVDFGTIQLLPDGQLIILMADHQTTGGYPRIAHVARVDLPLLAQLGPGDKVWFQPVTLPEAESLILEHENDLTLFRAGCRLRSWP